MAANHGALRWIVGDGAAAVAIEVGEPDTDLRIWLRSDGVGERSGMSLALGAAFPDIVGSFTRGDHHVAQDDMFVMRVGVQRAMAGVSAMLKVFDVDVGSIDHFMPAVSSLRLAEVMKKRIADELGMSPGIWRLNLDRVGYLGGVGFLVLLDEMARDGSLHAGDLVCAFAEESSKWMSAGAVLRWNP
jgi:3-oxoacyl-[acyl-carrier-protein] synthase III